jgi:hypothetical protein
MVAGAVAKAGFRQKPGPKKKARKWRDWPESGGTGQIVEGLSEPMAIGSMSQARRASSWAFDVEK